MEEINARMTADFDQAGAATKNMAVLLAGYFRNLVAEGLTREEALMVVCEYQEWLLTQGREHGR